MPLVRRRIRTARARLGRAWDDLPLRRKGLAVLSIPVGALLISLLAFGVQNRQEEDTASWMYHSRDVRTEIRNVLIALLNSETSVRGYLLTGQPDYLERYQQAQADVPPTLDRLEALIQDNPDQLARLDLLRPLVTERLDLLATVSELGTKSDSFPAAIPPDLLDEGKSTMDAVRDELAAMTAEEDRLLAERTAANERARTKTLVTIAGAGLFGVVSGLLAIALFSTGIVRRIDHLTADAQQLARGLPIVPRPIASDEVGRLGKSMQVASALLLEREQELRRWAHIFARAEWGIVVGRTDMTRLELLNPAFARMHGWTVEELTGRPISDVFTPPAWAAAIEHIRIAHETGHHAFESEHVRRDGTIFPVLIDVTAVKDETGTVLYRIANVQDISARRAAEAEIQQLNKDLELRVAELGAANRELEAFSYSVSHDLRAPLRGINGFTRFLLEDFGPDLPAEAQRLLGIVRDSAVQMGNLVDDLLAFSRLGRQPVRQQRVRPARIVQQVIDELGAELAGRQVEFVVGDLPVCAADPVLLKQVYFNLIANAVKFSAGREIATIEIGAQADDVPAEMVTYYVKDNGVGFDMAYVSKLFGVFNRLHRAEDYEGTGVGLAIVHRIIDRHGGRVWAEAEIDRGATFWFTLPSAGLASTDPSQVSLPVA